MASIHEFKRKYAKAINEGYAAVFAGAGLSRASGFVNWKDLLRGIASDIDLDIDIEHDMVAVAQYYCNEKHSRSQLNHLILNQFVSSGRESESLRILTSLPISVYWTTNYDHLIEDSLQGQGKRVDIKSTANSLASVLDGRDAVVYKMHGDYTIPESCVITKDDFEAYNQSRSLFTTALQGDLVSRTFLFIGFSFDDPNLEYVLSRIRALLNENQRQHFCFFEKTKKKRNESDEDFQYRKHKLELKIHDLMRYGIDAVMVDSYDDIPDILSSISRQVKSNCVFISGSAEVYGDWGYERAVALLHTLSEKLNDNNFKIVTGHGKGIGSYVISTVLEKYGNNIHEIERHLLIRAFPFQDKNRADYGKLVTEYRTGFFQQAGVAIFLFGNKGSPDDIQPATGAMQEFTLAQKHNCYMIPLGSTGFAAKDFFHQMYGQRAEYPYLEKYWDTLRSCMDPEELSECVLNILRDIQASF